MTVKRLRSLLMLVIVFVLAALFGPLAVVSDPPEDAPQEPEPDQGDGDDGNDSEDGDDVETRTAYDDGSDDE